MLNGVEEIQLFWALLAATIFFLGLYFFDKFRKGKNKKY